MSASPVVFQDVARALGRTQALRGTYAKETFARTCPVHVGVDAGKHFHKLVARGPTGPRNAAIRVEVSRDGFEAADRYLTEQFSDVAREQMLVGLEFAGHNGFTFARFLASRGYPVVSVLAFVTKRLKEVEDNSPRKDDAKDAGQICGLLSQGLFVGFPLLSDAATELRLLATERRRLAVEATRLKNRLHAALDVAWPEFVGHFAGLEFETPIALLERWPLPHELAAASPQAVHALIRKASHNHISPERIRAIIAGAKTTIAIPEGAAARRAELTRLLARWALVRAQIIELEERLKELVARTAAATALLSVPGVSVVCAATLVGELGDPHWYEATRQVLKLAGMNLARKESGVSVRGRLRQTKRGRPLLRRQLFLLAGRSCRRDGLYRTYYEALLARGKSRTSAVCAVARKLVPMLLTIMQTGAPFDRARWERDRRAPTTHAA